MAEMHFEVYARRRGLRLDRAYLARKNTFFYVLTGGACLLAICAVNEKMRGKSIFLRSAASAAAVTAAELAVGLVVNRLLGLRVWDYSAIFGNILGQICPLYSFLWFLLCLPICFAAERMGQKRA